jgi:hypothetical protein
LSLTSPFLSPFASWPPFEVNSFALPHDPAMMLCLTTGPIEPSDP